MINYIKQHYMKILVILLTFLFFNSCVKSCTRNIDLNNANTEIDSLYHVNSTLIDSINTLNNIIITKDIEIDNKNKNNEQLSNTLSSLINKQTTNNIRVIIPEQKIDTLRNDK